MANVSALFIVMTLKSRKRHGGGMKSILKITLVILLTITMVACDSTEKSENSVNDNFDTGENLIDNNMIDPETGLVVDADSSQNPDDDKTDALIINTLEDAIAALPEKEAAIFIWQQLEGHWINKSDTLIWFNFSKKGNPKFGIGLWQTSYGEEGSYDTAEVTAEYCFTVTVLVSKKKKKVEIDLSDYAENGKIVVKTNIGGDNKARTYTFGDKNMNKAFKKHEKLK